MFPRQYTSQTFSVHLLGQCSKTSGVFHLGVVSYVKHCGYLCPPFTDHYLERSK